MKKLIFVFLSVTCPARSADLFTPEEMARVKALPSVQLFRKEIRRIEGQYSRIGFGQKDLLKVIQMSPGYLILKKNALQDARREFGIIRSRRTS